VTAPAPYLSDSFALVKRSHEQRVTLTLTDGTDTWVTPLLGGDLTLSEDWSPRAQLSAVVPNIFTLAQLSAIDPRTGTAMATVDAGYVHPDGTVDVHTLFTGNLRERRLTRPANQIALEAASAEAVAQDSGWLATDLFKSFAGVTEAIEWFASYATGDTVTVTSSVGTGYRSDLTGSLPVAPGKPVWDFMADLALAADLALFVDSEGTWTLAPKPSEASGTDVTELAGNVSESDDVLSRNGYCSAAVLEYSWRDAMSVEHTIYGRYGTLPGRVYSAKLEAATTQAAADAAAQATVRNLSTRGNSYVCTSVAMYWVRPGSTVRVTLADGTDTVHLVKQVVFHLVAGTMTVTTREPTNLGD
jgi:hypothetical protein